MQDLPLSQPENTPPPPASRESGWRVWMVTAVCLLLAAAAAYYLVQWSGSDQRAREAQAPASRQSTPPAARTPLGPHVEATDLPPLDLSDPFVRDLLKSLSSRPELAAWLASDGLIRNIAASVDAIANGTTPSTQLRRLAPSGPFVAEPKGEEFVIDPRSYERFDGIAATAAALDPDGVARAYAMLRPRLHEAYRELGYPDGNFDDAVERAIVRLLNTPIVNEEVDVRPAPVLYQFTDTRLERLSPPQKQLLRMGPRNVRIIKDKLREIARALGIPDERLPSAP
jgi:hypothetical protein